MMVVARGELSTNSSFSGDGADIGREGGLSGYGVRSGGYLFPAGTRGAGNSAAVRVIVFGVTLRPGIIPYVQIRDTYGVVRTGKSPEIT